MKKKPAANEPTRLQWVSQKLRRLRQEQGLTLQGLADRIGGAHSRVSDTESGRYDIKLSTLMKMIEALGSTPNDFFRDMPPLREIGEGTREKTRKRD